MNPVISREYVEKNYIHKDKIRKMIKNLEREFDFYAGRCHWNGKMENLTEKYVMRLEIKYQF